MFALDGRKIAAEILERLKKLPAPKKFLGAVLAGDDAGSASFLKQKEKAAKELGVDFRLYEFPAAIGNDELRREVAKIVAHKTCGGFIVQLPLPENINRHYILNAIPPEKDIDVLGERALGAFYTGRGKALPPAAGVVAEIIRDRRLKIENTDIAVVGLGILVGKPVSVWLMKKCRNLFLLHRNSELSILKNADIVITGTGEAGLIKPEMLKPGASVIDFGYNGGRGDFDPEKLGKTVSADSAEKYFYTPTPGGTGPILVAKLLENFYELNRPDS